jgi:hypothetical protein
VKQCFPPDLPLDSPPCHCSPHISVRGAIQPFADRIVFIGDCGVTRLYKDGIGAAYRTAKAAATTAIFHGISSEDFRRHYWPVCRRIRTDNAIGKTIFAYTRQLRKIRRDVRAILRMVAREQLEDGGRPGLSMVLWDLVTGSAPYREILGRMLRPGFLARFLSSLIFANLPDKRNRG